MEVVFAVWSHLYTQFTTGLSTQVHNTNHVITTYNILNILKQYIFGGVLGYEGQLSVCAIDVNVCLQSRHGIFQSKI